MIQQNINSILELINVSYRYNDVSVGLDKCSLAIVRGSRTALLGANGAGKTTLFQQLNGIFRPQAGKVFFDGKELDYSRNGLYKLRSKVGIVFQNPDSQLFSASVREDVSFGPMNLGLDADTVKNRVEEALKLVVMTDHAEKPVHNLSYGQKKRVCIAGVLAMQPEVLILDEPMAGLDFQMQCEFMAVLAELHSNGMTIIIATHDMDFAWQWADELAILENGSCMGKFAIGELMNTPHLLSPFNLGVPSVATIGNALTQKGIFKKGFNKARTIDELVTQLEINKDGD